MNLLMRFLIPGIVAGLAGCAGGVKDNSSCDKHLIRIPLSRQATDHTCGVASLQSILSYYGFDYREDVLARELRADDHAKATEIKRFATSLGFRVREHHRMSLDDLEKFVDRGLPVLVCVQAWEPSGTTIEQYRECRESGHWVVVIGYDRHNVYMMDPSTHGNYTFVPREEFVARWHDVEGDTPVVRFGMTFEPPRAPVYRPQEFKKME